MMSCCSSLDIRIMALAGILNFFMPISFAQINPNCDFYQNMVMGQEYYIYNEEYPGYYPNDISVSCRWLAHSPAGTQIVISCENIDLPASTNCPNDRLAISLTGQSNFRDAHNYCGRGKITLVTESNNLAVGLFAPNTTPGGRFLCSLTSIQTGPPTTTTERPTGCNCGWRHLRVSETPQGIYVIYVLIHTHPSVMVLDLRFLTILSTTVSATGMQNDNAWYKSARYFGLTSGLNTFEVNGKNLGRKVFYFLKYLKGKSTASKRTRIVGGHETGVNEFPSMSALIDVFNRDLFCGASIISESYALTAAHCLRKRQTDQVGLLVGDHNITSGSDTNAAQLHALSQFIVHPQYDSVTQQNDIAVIKTMERITFSTRVGPICLPFRYTSYDFFGQVVTALGWGTSAFSGPKSDTLQAVDLGVVSNQDCAQQLPNDKISPSQLCTYAPDRDTCVADSGGPVLWQDTSSRRMQLVAIISFGLGCATPQPAVNTRVTTYLTWMLSVTPDANYCIK